MTEQNEPSMEDILASIRNILAEDEGNHANTAEGDSADKDEAPAAENAEMPAETPVEQEREEPVHVVVEPEKTMKKVEAEPAVMDLTSEMIVPAVAQNEQKPEAVVVENVPVVEEEEFVPEPVIPQKPMKKETLNDLIKENARERLGNDDDDSLLAEPTVIAATESLSHLRSFASEKRLELGAGNLTIEAIVRETLRPYLKEWLDVNLPEIVERVVKKEIAHIMDRLDLK